MLPKLHRLPKNKHNTVKNKGQLIEGDLFSLIVYRKKPKNIPTPPRFAFIVSKKTNPKACKRNQIKRLLRHVVFKLKNPIPLNLDIIFLTKKTLNKKSYKTIYQSTENLFKQLLNKHKVDHKKKQQ